MIFFRIFCLPKIIFVLLYYRFGKKAREKQEKCGKIRKFNKNRRVRGILGKFTETNVEISAVLSIFYLFFIYFFSDFRLTSAELNAIMLKIYQKITASG